MTTVETRQRAIDKPGHTKWRGITGLVLLLSSFALPCNAQDAPAETEDANVFQLMRLLNQNEELLFEIEKLRGQVEDLIQGARQSRKSQTAIATDFDSRLEEIEAKPNVDTDEDKAKISALETRVLQIEEALAAMHEVISSTAQTPLEANPSDEAYETALQTYQAGDYDTAVSEFRAFLDAYGSDAAAPNARYWLAEALLRLNDYGTAIEEGEMLISTHPDSDKIPDTIFLVGKAHLAMGDPYAARDTWEALVADYADSEAAVKARDLLDRLP